jgi:hypothetical protein
MRIRFFFLFTILFQQLSLDAQFRFLLRFTSQVKGPGQRSAYVLRSERGANEERVILPGPGNSHYAIHFSEALIKRIVINEEGTLEVDWEPFTTAHYLTIDLIHSTPWSSVYGRILHLKHLSKNDYLELSFMIPEKDTLDLSYGYNLNEYKLITPTFHVGDTMYRNLTCLYKDNCQPFFKQIRTMPPDSPSRTDSLPFFKRMTAINTEMLNKADSVMRHHFGDEVFEKYFRRACFQKICGYGYPQDNYGYLSFAPCEPLPDTSCNSADILYKYVNGNRKVNLEMRVKIFLKNQPQAWLFDGGPTYRSFSVEEMNLLSLEEIQAILKRKYPNDSLRSLSASLRTGPLPKQDVIFVPGIPPHLSDPPEGPGFPKSEFLEEVSEFGKRWKGGYVYEFNMASKHRAKPNGNSLWYIDAVSGQFLYSVFRLSVVQESMPRIQ